MDSIPLWSDFQHPFVRLYSGSSRRQWLRAAGGAAVPRYLTVPFQTALALGCSKHMLLTQIQSAKRKVSTHDVRFWPASSSTLRALPCLSHLPTLNVYNWVTKSFPHPLTHARSHQDSVCALLVDVSPACPPDNRTGSYQGPLMEM